MSLVQRIIVVSLLELAYIVIRRVVLHYHAWPSFEAEAISTAVRLITAGIDWHLFRSLINSRSANQSALRSPWLVLSLFLFLAIPVLVGRYTLSAPVALMFACTSLFVAIKEEFLFRGILQNLLDQKLGSLKAIFLTSIAFTVWHIGVWDFTVWVVGQIFFASVLLGVVYVYGGSIVAVIAIHTVYDAIFSFTPLVPQPLPENWGFLPLLAAMFALTYWARGQKLAA